MKATDIKISLCTRRGFTLIELSVVLAIIAAIIGMAMASGYSIVASARVTSTNQKMAAIDQALFAFRLANDRIPCPADFVLTPSNSVGGTDTISSVTYTDNFGYEWQPCAVGGAAPSGAAYNWMFFTQNIGSSGNQVAEGAVPVQTLGLANDFMYDGWGNKFSYAVDVNMTYPGSFSGTPVGAVCGGITVFAPGSSYPANSTNGLYRSNGTGGYTGSTPGYIGAIYALVSHGANQHGAISANGQIVSVGSNNADEQTNCHCTSSAYTYNTYAATYVQSAPYTYKAYPAASTPNATYNFDDIVTFKERWQMQGPNDVQGTMCPGVFVADAGSNKRIQMLDLRGNALLTYANANLTNPTAVRIDINGNIWTVSNGYNSVLELNSSGTFVRGVGCGYQNLTSGTCAGGTGTASYQAGAFDVPQNLAIDASGNIWVSDTGNNRIEEFTSAGAFIQQIPAANNTTACPGTAIPACTASVNAGQFSGPLGLAFDQSGYLWVVDSGNNRLQKFDQYGNYDMSIPPASSCVNTSVPACTAAPTTNGQFSAPQDVAIDAGGNLWVSEAGSSSHIQEFNNNGTWIGQITNSFSQLRGIALDAFGDVWTTDNSKLRVYECKPVNGGSCTTYGSSGSSNGQYSGPNWIAVIGR